MLAFAACLTACSTLASFSSPPVFTSLSFSLFSFSRHLSLLLCLLPSALSPPLQMFGAPAAGIPFDAFKDRILNLGMVLPDRDIARLFRSVPSTHTATHVVSPPELGYLTCYGVCWCTATSTTMGMESLTFTRWCIPSCQKTMATTAGVLRKRSRCVQPTTHSHTRTST